MNTTMRSTKEIISILNARGYLRFISDVKWLKYRYKEVYGEDLDLQNPMTFNEKLQWMKLNYRNPTCTEMVDKISAKEYVKRILGEEIGIIPTYGVWGKFEDIDWSTLPKQFVLKCNHDSGGLVICRDKDRLDYKSAKQKINKCLKRNYFWHGREWVYKEIKPRILAEKYMETQGQKEICDYKFYCFNGVVKCLYVSQGLENHSTARVAFLDENYNRLPFRRTDYAQFEELPPKPVTFETMKRFAEKLSEGFPFLRVDLYEINGKVYFSELTFIPCSGWMTIEPKDWDLKLGEWLQINA